MDRVPPGSIWVGRADRHCYAGTDLILDQMMVDRWVTDQQIRLRSNNNKGLSMTLTITECALCGAETTEGLCDKCSELYWIDPAGGIHRIGEEDPAKMYE